MDQPRKELGKARVHRAGSTLGRAFATPYQIRHAASPYVADQKVDVMRGDIAGGFVAPTLRESPAYWLEVAGPQPKQPRGLRPSTRLGARMFFDESPRGSAERAARALFGRDSAALFLGSVVGHDVAPQRALALNVRRQLTGPRKRQGPAHHRRARAFIAAQVRLAEC